MKNNNKPLLILVAGPYRSGTNDIPERIAANVKTMTDTALELYRMGHMPVLGEWFALPLIEAAGSKQIGDQIFNDIFHPIAVKLIDHCDAVLRIGGPSAGADAMVATGKAKSKAAAIHTPGGRCLQIQLIYSRRLLSNVYGRRQWQRTQLTICCRKLVDWRYRQLSLRASQHARKIILSKNINKTVRICTSADGTIAKIYPAASYSAQSTRKSLFWSALFKNWQMCTPPRF